MADDQKRPALEEAQARLAAHERAERDRELLCEVQAFPAPALVVRPGEHVLIALNHQPDGHAAHRMLEYLHTRIPGVTFALVGDVAGLAVVRRDDPDQ
jgi:hypothetical protein